MRVTRSDRIRCAAVHAHADLRVAGRMLCRLRLIAAWQKLKSGYARLDRALLAEKQETNR